MNTTTALAEARPEKRPLEQYLTNAKTIEGIKAVAGKYLQADRMLRIVTFALRKVPKLADCDPQSFLGSVMTSAALGLEPNTPQGHAYLIPYDKRGKLPSGKWGVIATECQFIIGYRGYLELAYRNPNIVKFIAKAVHANDHFDHCEGSESFLRFKPAMQDRGPLIGAFAYAKYKAPSGAEAEMSVILPIEEIYKSRAKSETYNYLVRNVEQADNEKDRATAQKKLDETPWVMWEDDMSAKTALRKLAKVIPMGDAFGAAVAIEDATERRTMDLTAMADPNNVKSVIAGEIDPPVIEHDEEEEMPPVHLAEAPRAASPKRTAKPAAQQDAGKETPPASQEAPLHDPDTGEIHDDQPNISFGDE